MPDEPLHSPTKKYCFVYSDAFDQVLVDVAGDPVRKVRGEQGDLSTLLYAEEFWTWSDALARCDELRALSLADLLNWIATGLSLEKVALLSELKKESVQAHDRLLEELFGGDDPDPGPDGLGGCRSFVPGGPLWRGPDRPYGERHEVPCQ